MPPLDIAFLPFTLRYVYAYRYAIIHYFDADTLLMFRFSLPSLPRLIFFFFRFRCYIFRCFSPVIRDIYIDAASFSWRGRYRI